MAESFEYIKELLITPLVLRLPTANDTFILETGTSKTSVEVALFQFQQGP